jgi:subtilisin family serine protease
MGKHSIFSVFLFVFIGFIYGQNNQNYYWYKNQKIYLNEITEKRFLLVDETINNEFELEQTLGLPDLSIVNFRKSNIFASVDPYNPAKTTERNWAIIEGENLHNINFLNYESILYNAPFFISQNNIEAGISHLFYVKLFNEQDITVLELLAEQNNVEILGNNKFMPLWVTLACTKYSNGNAMEMANAFYETGLFAASKPDLMTKIGTTCVNDPLFSHQWGLENTGQSGGIAGIDIKACQAWAITTGSSNTIVAVIDMGIQLNHPDLTNIYPISFDTETGQSPSQIYHPHGTASAGIIGATHNNIGLAGVAPDCPIMSISSELGLYDLDLSQKLANGLNFAWSNNASVINNSWSHNTLEDDMLDDAIDNALTYGRSGLGCIVVFSSGNNNSQTSNYPSNSNPSILNVGAVDRCGVRSGSIDIIPQSCDPWISLPGSAFGVTLDIVAPGTNIPTTNNQFPLICYPGGDYFLYYGGTSAAAPHVAGVAALILSVNPCLTQKQVADIIEQTAQKVRLDLYNYQNIPERPNGTWNIEMGYGLVDAYAAVLLAQQMYIPSENFTVNTGENIIWTDEKRVDEFILVKEGGKLTIETKVYFSENGKIIIEPGGKLTIDGGKLTNDICLGIFFWQGIEVHGNKNASQLTPGAQGIVELRNGAVIENALDGIRNWNPNDWDARGGIIVCEDALFKNNRRAIEFVEYRNTSPNNPNQYLNDLSHFKNTSFVVDDDYIGTDEFYAHVSMWRVHGVVFDRCIFKNEMTHPTDDNFYNNGIHAHNAGFTVKGFCNMQNQNSQPCPPTYLQSSEFTGFKRGIHITSSNSVASAVHISQSVFQNNNIGIQTSSLSNFNINRNQFVLGNNNYTNDDIGMYISHSTDFSIQENTISSQTPFHKTTWGIIVNNSGENDNVVYKNTLNELSYGLVAMGNNRSTAPNTITGLKFLCNENYGDETQNIHDIYVFGQRRIDGVALYQGDNVVSAGNIFSVVSDNGTNRHIQNVTHPFNYYFSGLPQTSNIYFPQYASPNYVLTHSEITPNQCLSNFANFNIINNQPLTQSQKNQLNTELQNTYWNYANLLFSYNQLIDGGNTNLLLDEIQNSWSSDAWRLRQELLEITPYLSQEALLEAAFTGVLPEAMLFEICILNKEATYGDEFLYIIGNEIPIPLPQYMINIIVSAWGEETPRKTIESNLSKVSHHIALLTNILIDDLLNDSTYHHMQINNFLQNRGSVSDYFSIVERHLSIDDTNTAETTLFSIPNMFELTENQIAKYEDFLWYLGFIDIIHSSGRTNAQLEQYEIETLEMFVENSNSKLGDFCKNILCFFYQICSEPQLPVHMQDKRTEAISRKNPQTMTKHIQTMPNPASTHLTLKWENMHMQKGSLIHIITQQGLIIQTFEINTNQGQVIWDTREIPNGIYLYKLQNTNGTIETGKIMIAK